MSDLVTFGCSYTYGHGLPDCFTPPKGPGKEPSKLGWPNLLANLLNRNVVNNSKPGSSNVQILWRLLNYPFSKDDLCVIMWTHFNRHPFHKLNMDPYYHDSGEFLQAKNNTSHADIDEDNLKIRNFLSINHAHLYLNSKNIEHYFLLVPYPEHTYRCPQILSTPIIKNIHLSNMLVDRALDNAHPGEKSHKLMSVLIYNEIKKNQ